MNQPLSVTVLADTTGSDQSILLNRVLKSSHDLRITVIVPKYLRKHIQEQHGLVVVSTKNPSARPGQACACCTVRSDVIHKIRQIVEKKRTDHIVIQTAPEADLEILAKTFEATNKRGQPLSEVARLESLAVVVDANTLLSTLKTKTSRRLVERIELANVVLLRGVNGLTSEVYSNVVRALITLNPDVHIIQDDEDVQGAKDDELTLASLRAEHPYNLKSIQRRAQKLNSFDRTDQSRAVAQFTYRDRRPFHPERLHKLIGESWGEVLRARGTFWVASRPDYACELDIAGGSRRTSAEGKWWVAIPAEEQSEDPRVKDYLDEIWHETFGDRYQEITIVGVNIDERDLRRRLDQCLLNDEELAHPEAWPALPHPFAWPRKSARNCWR